MTLKQMAAHSHQILEVTTSMTVSPVRLNHLMVMLTMPTILMAWRALLSIHPTLIPITLMENIQASYTMTLWVMYGLPTCGMRWDT
jgi:hypothetical protein